MIVCLFCLIRKACVCPDCIFFELIRRAFVQCDTFAISLYVSFCMRAFFLGSARLNFEMF